MHCLTFNSSCNVDCMPQHLPVVVYAERCGCVLALYCALELPRPQLKRLVTGSALLTQSTMLGPNME
jgi:hypothetical protein